MTVPEDPNNQVEREERPSNAMPNARPVRRIMRSGISDIVKDTDLKKISDRHKETQKSPEEKEVERKLEREKLKKRFVFLRPNAKRYSLSKLKKENGEDRSPEELQKMLEERDEVREIKEHKGTQVFLDRCGFTNTTNTYIELFPKGQVKINREVNELLTLATNIFRSFGGEIIEFQGDAMRAFFPEEKSDTKDSNHAHRAVKAMTCIQKAVEELKTDWIAMNEQDKLKDPVNKLPTAIAQAIDNYAKKPRDASFFNPEKTFKKASIEGRNVFVEHITCEVDDKTKRIGISLDSEKKEITCHIPDDIDSPIRKIRIKYVLDKDTGKMVPQKRLRGIVSEIKMGAASDTTEEIIVGKERLTSMVTQNSVELAEGKAGKGESILHPSTVALLGAVHPVSASPVKGHEEYLQLDTHSRSAKEVYEASRDIPPVDEEIDNLTIDQLKFLNEEGRRFLDPENLKEIDGIQKESPEKAAGMYRTCAMMLKFPYVAELLENQDPEVRKQKLEVVANIHSIISRTSKHFGIRMVKCPAGTTYIALSGIPTSSNPTNEDFEYRAVLCGIEIEKQLMKLKEESKNEAYSVYGGIHTDTNFWGPVGSTDIASEFSPIGPNVNMSARIAYDKKNLEPGINVSTEVSERLRERINFSQQGVKRQYKGFKEEREIHRAIGIDKMGTQESHRGETYGYEYERSRLQDITKKATGINISIVEGHGGIGKSRILYDQQNTIAIGHCDEFSEDHLMCFRGIIRNLIKQELDRNERNKTDKRFRETIDELLTTVTDNESEFTLEDFTPLLCEFIGVEAEDNETTKSIRQMNGVEEKMPTLIKAIIRALLQKGPISIAIDDLHNASKQTQEFIEEVIDDAKKHHEKLEAEEQELASIEEEQNLSPKKLMREVELREKAKKNGFTKHALNVIGATRPKISLGKHYDQVHQWLDEKLQPTKKIGINGVSEKDVKKIIFITHLPFTNTNDRHFSTEKPEIHVEPKALVDLLIATVKTTEERHDPKRAISFAEAIKGKLTYIPPEGLGSNGYYEASTDEDKIRANMTNEALKRLVGKNMTSTGMLTQRLQNLSYEARTLLGFAASLGGLFTEDEIRTAVKTPAGWFRNGQHPLKEIIKKTPVETEDAIDKAIKDLENEKLLGWGENEYGESCRVIGTDIKEVVETGEAKPGVTRMLGKDQKKEKPGIDVTEIRTRMHKNIEGTKAMELSETMKGQSTDTSDTDIAAGFALQERAKKEEKDIVKAIIMDKALTSLVSARQQLQGTGPQQEVLRINDIDQEIVELGEEAGSLWLKFDQRMAEKCFRTAKDHCKDKKRKISLTFAQLVPLAQTGKNEEAREMYETMREKFEAEGLGIIERLETLQKEAQSIEKDNTHDREAVCTQLEEALEAGNKVIPDKDLHTQLNEEIDTFEQILSSRRDPIINKELRDKAVERLQSILESVEKEESVAPKIQNTCLKLQGILTGIIEGNGKYTEDIELRRLCEVIGGKPTKDRFQIALDETEGMLQKMYIHQVKIVGNLIVQIRDKKEKNTKYGRLFEIILKTNNIKLLRVVTQNIAIVLTKLKHSKGACHFVRFCLDIIENKNDMSEEERKKTLYFAIKDPEKIITPEIIKNTELTSTQAKEANLFYKAIVRSTENNRDQEKELIRNWINFMKLEMLHILGEIGQIDRMKEILEEMKRYNASVEDDKKEDLTNSEWLLSFNTGRFNKAVELMNAALENKKQKGFESNEIEHRIMHIASIALAYAKENKDSRRINEALTEARQIEKRLSQISNFKDQYSHFYPIYAWCHHLAGNNEKALEIISKPGAIGKPYEILGKGIQGIILHKNGDQNKAEECYKEAMTMIKEKERDEDWNIEYTHEWMYLSELGKSLSGIAA